MNKFFVVFSLAVVAAVAASDDDLDQSESLRVGLYAAPTAYGSSYGYGGYGGGNVGGYGYSAPTTYGSSYGYGTPITRGHGYAATAITRGHGYAAHTTYGGYGYAAPITKSYGYAAPYSAYSGSYSHARPIAYAGYGLRSYGYTRPTAYAGYGLNAHGYASPGYGLAY